MTPKQPLIEPLSDERQIALQSGLALASRLAGADRPLNSGQVQALYDSALAESVDDADIVIAIGLAFGQLIVDRADFEWARVNDEYGDETCVAARGKEIFCAPISMIQKRLARDEALDVDEFCDETIKVIRTRIAEGKAADR